MILGAPQLTARIHSLQNLVIQNIGNHVLYRIALHGQRQFVEGLSDLHLVLTVPALGQVDLHRIAGAQSVGMIDPDLPLMQTHTQIEILQYGFGHLQKRPRAFLVVAEKYGGVYKHSVQYGCRRTRYCRDAGLDDLHIQQHRVAAFGQHRAEGHLRGCRFRSIIIDGILRHIAPDTILQC